MAGLHPRYRALARIERYSGSIGLVYLIVADSCGYFELRRTRETVDAYVEVTSRDTRTAR